MFGAGAERAIGAEYHVCEETIAAVVFRVLVCAHYGSWDMLGGVSLGRIGASSYYNCLCSLGFFVRC